MIAFLGTLLGPISTYMTEVHALIEEFEAEAESKKRQLRRQAENLCSSLKNALEVELMRLPRNIRQMPVMDFMEKYGGQVDAVAFAEYQQLAETIRTPSLGTAKVNGQSRPALTDQTFVPPATSSRVPVKPMDMFKTLQSARRPAPQSALRVRSESLFDEAVSGGAVPATPLVSQTYRGPRQSTLYTGTTKRKKAQAPSTQKKARTFTGRTAKTPGNVKNTARRPRRGDKLKASEISTIIQTDDGAMIDIGSPTTRRQLTDAHKKAAMEKLVNMHSQMSSIMKELRG